MNKQFGLGQSGEMWARRMYERRGYKIFGSNIFNRKGKRIGEIDFVAIGPRYIVFVEVKTRTKQTGRFGLPQESVNFFKQQRLLRMIKWFLIQNPKFQNLAPRIDVCVIICGLDKHPQRAIIIPNAVEDQW